MKKKNIYLNQVTAVGFVKNLLIMMNKKLDIIFRKLVNLEALHIGTVTNLQLTKKVPVTFHNLKGYDSHLIINELNSSLEKLVKNLSDEDFNFLVEEFSSRNSELLKQKRWTVLKDLMKLKCLLEKFFAALQRMENLVMMVKYQTST